MSRGKVFLIGAGPGNVELLTLQAVRTLGLADVVLLDDLVNRDVLQFVRRDARVVEVGKRGGCKSTPQAFIHRLMVALANKGKVVARVKGGDPFIFGRGGEEVERLTGAGIAVEVVSGITSGMAVPAALGIPATHRDFAHGVTFVTGHSHRDNELGREPDWDALAASGTTLVIYMGMANLDAICTRLAAAGMAGNTPVAAIQNGTLPGQRAVVSTLARIAQDVREQGLRSPAIVVIGQVVKFARITQHAARGLQVA
jgi:uroporphyrin-III C-methyltransferase